MPPRKQSPVWKYFHVSTFDENKAICNLCKLSLSRGGGEKKNYGTSCLLKHLKNAHKREFNQIEIDQLSLNNTSIVRRPNVTKKRPTSNLTTLSNPPPECYKLCHNNHLLLVLESLAGDESFMDVTLTAQGKTIKAHKSVLSAVSPYFRSVLKANPCQHPIIIMPRDIKFDELNNIIKYVYKGEIMVATEELPSFLKTADVLQIKGLSPSGAVGSSTCKYIESTQGLPSGFYSAPTDVSCNPPFTFKHTSEESGTEEALSPSNKNAPVIDIHSESQGTLNPLDFLQANIDIKEEVQCDDDEIAEFNPVIVDFHSSASSDHASTSGENSGSMESSDTNIIDGQIHDLGDVSPLHPSSQEDKFTTENANSIFNPGEIFTTLTSEEDNTNFTISPYICPHCFESHRPNKALQVHLRLKHPSKPSFLCDCGRVFIKQSLLIDHKKKCDL